MDRAREQDQSALSAVGVLADTGRLVRPFEPDDAVDFQLNRLCEGLVSRMLDHFPKFPKDQTVTFVAGLAQTDLSAQDARH